MKKQLSLAVLISLFVGVSAMAQSPFDGTWKIDISKTQLPPIDIVLQDGMYHCKSCNPAIDVKADGQDYKVTGSTENTAAVKVLDDHTLQLTGKQKGKVTGIVKYTVATDGNTLKTEIQNFAANGTKGTVNREYKRTAKGPPGAHVTSGSWRLAKVIDASDSEVTTTLRIEGDHLIRDGGLGNGYNAKLDGTDAPFGTNTVSVKRLDKNTIEETTKRDGKVIVVNKLTVSSNGKTLTLVSENKLAGTKATRVLIKQ